MSTKIVGIIAEDISDVNTIKILIQKICNKKITTKQYVGHGCGPIIRKCNTWAKSLFERDCRFLIVMHDSDGKPAQTIYDKINKELNNTKFKNTLICIPIQELEAWLLSDPEGIKNAMNLKSIPKIKGNPETIISPKEKIEEIVSRCSNKTKLYINTKHNEILAKFVSIENIYKKCDSFKPFHSFIKTNLN